MKTVPNFLTRYYIHGENPFTSLNDHSFERANEIKKNHCIKNNIGGFYAEDDYLIHRKEIEKWIYNQLVEKGGNPQNTVPIYMTLGESPHGDFDIREEIQKNAEEVKILLNCLDLSAISFTFPDSMYRFVMDNDGDIVGGERTNTPNVYLYNEIEEVISKYKTDLHYIEAQVWNRDMLFDYLKNMTE